MTAAKAKKTAKRGPVPIPSPVLAKPAASAPDVPANFQPLDATQTRVLRKPTAQQVSAAPAVATEITGSTTYSTDFGSKAVTASTYSADLTTASAWSVEAARAQRWSLYARQMAGLAWNQVLGETETFKIDYTTAAHHDGTIAERYPATTSFVGTRSASAQRGAKTKKEKKKAATAAAAAPVAAPPAATPAKTGS
jgi:hypothetical protein